MTVLLPLLLLLLAVVAATAATVVVPVGPTDGCSELLVTSVGTTVEASVATSASVSGVAAKRQQQRGNEGVNTKVCC